MGLAQNGKTTLINVLAQLLGTDYCGKAARELIVMSRSTEHKTIFADLFGKRLVYSEETGENERLSEGQIKDLTGGGVVKSRRMKEDLWEFQPTHKLVLATNHKPDVRGTDHGIWRRLKLIPFNVVIPEDDQDPQLGNKLKAELSGILNWCLEGCLLWQSLGLREPELVREATQVYRKESDVLGQFIEEHCIVGDEFIVQSTHLFDAYKAAGGSMTQTKFGRAMKERFKSDRPDSGPNRKKTCYIGIGLISRETTIAHSCPQSAG